MPEILQKLWLVVIVVVVVGILIVTVKSQQNSKILDNEVMPKLELPVLKGAQLYVKGA